MQVLGQHAWCGGIFPRRPSALSFSGSACGGFGDRARDPALSSAGEGAGQGRAGRNSAIAEMTCYAIIECGGSVAKTSGGTQEARSEDIET